MRLLLILLFAANGIYMLVRAKAIGKNLREQPTLPSFPTLGRGTLDNPWMVRFFGIVSWGVAAVLAFVYYA